MNMFFANFDYKLTDADVKRLGAERRAWEAEQLANQKNNKQESYEKPYEWGDEYGYIKH